MENKFYSLKGLRIFSIDYDAEVLEFKFDGEFSLSIYNLYSFADLEEKSLKSLVGMIVNDVLIDKESFRLYFDKVNKSFDVDLRDSAFRGPEAMVLRMPDQSLVVWV